MITKKVPNRILPKIRREDMLLKLNALNDDVTQIYKFVEDLIYDINNELNKRDELIENLTNKLKTQRK